MFEEKNENTTPSGFIPNDPVNIDPSNPPQPNVGEPQIQDSSIQNQTPTAQNVPPVEPVYQANEPATNGYSPNYGQPFSQTEPSQYHQSSAPYTPPVNANAPVMNKINYTPTAPIKDYKPASRGLKIFAAVIAGVILLSSACVTGFFFGKSSVSSFTGKEVKLDLAAKPKDTDQMTPAQVYEEANESIVGIRVYNNQSASDASGVIYSKDGYIVTNDHIYSEIGAPKFKIYMHDGTERTATYVAGDTISDLAVLKLDDKSDLTPATFGDSKEIFCGENVVAMGRPSDATYDTSITTGIISLTKRRMKTASNYTASLIQTDSAINPGSSGGALINMYGQVIGITSSKLAGIDYDSVGFAIPTTTVKRVVEQLISKGKVTNRAKLGITYTEVNSVTAEISGQSIVGLYIASVGEDSDLYGKVAEGDIITHINNHKITSDDIVLDIIEECVAGDSVTLTIVNTKGATKNYSVTLRANIGESSYTEVISNNKGSNENSSGSQGGTFDFPFGE